MSVEPGYPSRPKLSESDMLEVLSVGPRLKWLFPVIVLGEVRIDHPNRQPYGLVHWYYNAEGVARADVKTFRSAEDIRWAADRLYQTHQSGCRCVAMFYWEPRTVNYGVEHIEAAA